MSKYITKITENRIPGKNIFKVKDTVFIVDDRYEFIKLVGIGAYGVVVSALDTVTKTKVAIKKIPKAFEDLIDAKRIYREIKLLEFFDNENIISLLDIQRPPAKTGYEDIYFVTDLMETDLHRVIYSKQELSDEHIQYFIYQILRGVHYMHSCNVIHRDLKPSNLLLNKKCDVKICDFGLSRGFNVEEKNNLMTEYVVTRWYRAPEVILNAKNYSAQLDVWSVGCILAEILGKQPLLPGQDYLDQVNRIIGLLGTPTEADMAFISNDSAKRYIRKLKTSTKKNFKDLFPRANKECLDLLQHMLVFNPNNRWTVDQLLKHKYFQELHSQEDIKKPSKFDWSIDDFVPTKELLQSKIYNESLRYHPEKDRNIELKVRKKEVPVTRTIRDIDEQLEAKYKKTSTSTSRIAPKDKDVSKRSQNSLIAKNLLNNYGVYKNPYQKNIRK